jgi:hypothetical protein
MKYADSNLRSLYKLPIEKIDSRPFERTWYGRELVDLIDGQGSDDRSQSLLAGTQSFDRSNGGRPSTLPVSPSKLPTDPGLISDEFYVRRIGYDRFLLLHGEYFNLNADTLAQWHDLRSLVSCAA